MQAVVAGDDDAGLATAAAEAVAAEDYCAPIDRALSAVDIPVGLRGSGGLHFYAGYNGSMSWEYNLGACDDAGLADLCACVGTNNALAYQRESGQACRGTGENVYPSASARFA